jgi:hypothetical protein
LPDIGAIPQYKSENTLLHADACANSVRSGTNTGPAECRVKGWQCTGWSVLQLYCHVSLALRVSFLFPRRAITESQNMRPH